MGVCLQCLGETRDGTCQRCGARRGFEWPERKRDTTGWQPIEAIPLDTPVLVYGPGLTGRNETGVAELRRIAKGRTAWNPAGVSGYECEFDIIPTHWMPLPEPPK